VAAARTIIRARLGWLRGFPRLDKRMGGVEWTVVPRPAEAEPLRRFALDGQRLYETVYAVKRLRGRFPRALPRIVPDVESWAAQVEARVAILDGAVHRRAPFSALDVLVERIGIRPATSKALRRAVLDDMRLVEIAQACLWIHWGDSPAVERVVHHLTALGGYLRTLLERCGADLSLLLLDWVVAEKAGAVECLRYLGEDANWTTSLSPAEHLRSMRTAFESRAYQSHDVAVLAASIPGPLPGRTPRHLADLLLAQQNRPELRDPMLLVIPYALPPALMVRRWQTWWKRVAVWKQRFPYAAPEQLGDELKRIASTCPRRRNLRLHRFVEDFETVLTWTGGRGLGPIVQALLALPADPSDQPPQAQFLSALSRHVVRSRPAASRAVEQALVQLLRLLTSRVVAASDPELGRAVWVANVFFPLLLERLSDDERWTSSQLAAAFESLGQLLPDLPPTHAARSRTEVWDVFLTVVRTGLAAASVLRLTRVLLEHVASRPLRRASEGAAVEVALDLYDGEAEAFVVLLESLSGWDRTTLCSLRCLLATPEHRTVLREMLVGGEVERIARFLTRAALLPTFTRGRRLDSLLTLPDADGKVDVQRYPAVLRPLLLELARVDPEASRSADRILGVSFPDHGRLRDEIRALSRLLAGRPLDAEPRMRARLANLKVRLAEATSISEVRLRRLADKLRRRTWQATLEHWDRAIARSLEEGVSARLGTRPPLAWLAEPYVGVLASVCQLATAFRDLAFRLLRQRLGPPPWDLRDDHVNRSFLERMRKRGLIMEPWLDGPGPLFADTPVGPLTLALERDPMEVFRMGEPFGTCLSPGSVNFFSAVANAADINKRVLYAKDAGGTIRGRCLLALTRQGHLLTFEPYAHDRGGDFASQAGQFVLRLAEAMNTTVAGHGEVERLVAGDWYDDGPRDLTGAFSFLEGGSAFRRGLSEMQPSDLLPTLEVELGRRELVAVALPQILFLPELGTRPQLVRGLLGLIESAGMDRRTHLKAAELARRAGDAPVARRILAGLARPAVWRRMAHWEQQGLAGELIDSGLPELAMRLLREELSDDADTKELKARACEALGRPQQALSLYREVLAEKDRARHLRERIEVLEAELGEG
jgi:hypothetical protein